MRQVIILSILILFCFQLTSQTDKIESLVRRIDNSQFKIHRGYITWCSVASPAADTLINIGKPVTKTLLSALLDSNKVIVAHYILCLVWSDSCGFGAGKPIKTNNIYISKWHFGRDKDSSLIINEVDMIKMPYRLYIESDNRNLIVSYWRKKTSYQ